MSPGKFELFKKRKRDGQETITTTTTERVKDDIGGGVNGGDKRGRIGKIRKMPGLMFTKLKTKVERKTSVSKVYELPVEPPPVAKVEVKTSQKPTRPIKGEIKQKTLAGATAGKPQKAKIVPISKRVNSRHLQMEPLCCLSSYPVREGCVAVGIFELVVVFATTALLLYRMIRQGFWQPIVWQFPRLLTHPLLTYIFICYNVLMVITVIAMLIGVYKFSTPYVRWHYCMQVVALIVSIAAISLLVVAIKMSSSGWGLVELGLTAAFSFMILVELWGLSVVRECLEYFQLCRVLVNLAEYGHG